MLTQEEKDRIWHQEEYRHEVSREIKAKSADSKGNRIWQSLNSAFVLWVLSTVVIGSASFLYTRWEQRRELHKITLEQAAIKRREDALTVRKLDGEIASRLSYVQSVIRLSKPSQAAFVAALRALENPSREAYSATMFQEYEKRSLRSLVWELLQVLPEDVDAEERQRVLVAYDRARLLPTIYTLATASDQGSPLSTESAAAARSNLESVMIKCFDLERWGKPFTWEQQRRHPGLHEKKSGRESAG